MKIVSLGAALLVLSGCPKPVPVPPPNPDASDASAFGDAHPLTLDDCQRGCAALAAISCTLGDGGADCADFLRVINGGKEPNPLTHRPLTCADIAAVRSRADAQRLGFACPP